MRVASRMSSIVIVMFGLATLLLPVSAQTAPPPEATPEFWPLSFDPAAVTADPATYTLLFAAPYTCMLSPNRTVVALARLGIYDLATGKQRFATSGRVVAFSPVAPLIQIKDDGVYNYETGERVIETHFPTTGTFSPDGRWFIDYERVYDLHTGEMVAEIDRWGDGDRSTSSLAVFADDSSTFTYSSEDEFEATVNTTNWQPLNDYPFKDELLARPESYWLWTGLVFVAGDGVYSAKTGEEVLDVPDTELVIWKIAPDVSRAFLFRTDEIVVYDMTDWSEYQRIAIDVGGPEIAWQTYLSFGGRIIGVPDYTEVMSGGTTSYLTTGLRIVDVASGQILSRISQFHPNLALISGTNFLVMQSTGVYDITTGAQVFALTADEYVHSTPDSATAILRRPENFSLIDTATWTTRFTLDGVFTHYDMDFKTLLVKDVGVFDSATGQLLAETPNAELVYTRDGRYLVSKMNAPCVIYSVPEA